MLLYCDNQSAIAVAKDDQFHACTKHINIQYHFICEVITWNLIEVRYCPTQHMVANIFIKVLLMKTFEQQCTLLGIYVDWGGVLLFEEWAHICSPRWQVTLPIYTTIQFKLQWHLHPFLSSSPHHSQTANVSSQSVLPITIINMSSNSIPLQSMSRWSLDSNDYDAHVNLRNQLHSQHPQLLPLARLRTMQSQPALNKCHWRRSTFWRFSWTVHIFRRKVDPSTQ